MITNFEQEALVVAMTKNATSHLLPVFARVDLGFEREGAWLVATNGERYLDFTSGVRSSRSATAIRTWSHPCRIRPQALAHVEPVQEPGFGERLAARLVAARRLCLFANSGAGYGMRDQITRNIRRQGSAQRYRIVTFEGAFHGRTLATLAQPPGPNISKVLARDGRFRSGGARDLDAVRKAISPQTAWQPDEPLQRGRRARGLTPLQAPRQLCDDNDLLLISMRCRPGWGAANSLDKRLGVTFGT